MFNSRDGIVGFIDGDMEPLYHYTKYESAIAILKGISRQDTGVFMMMRASCAYCMDDQLEMNFGYPFIKHVLDDLVEQGTISNETGLIDLFREEIKHISKPDSNIFLPESRTPFVISFTHEYNNEKFWREYGENGCGVCFIFDGDMLYELARQRVDNFLSDVAYLCSEHMDYEVWSSLINVVTEKIIEIQSHTPLLKKEDINRFQRILLDSLCPVISALIKDGDKYVWENEVRWISICDNSYAKVNNLSKPYFDVPIPIDFLKGCLLGPKCDRQEELLSLFPETIC